MHSSSYIGFYRVEHKFIQCKFDLLAKKRETKITDLLTLSCPAEQMFNQTPLPVLPPACLLLHAGETGAAPDVALGRGGVLIPTPAQAPVLSATALAFTPVEQLHLFAF